MKLVRISAMWCSSCLATKKDFKKIKEQNPTLVTEEWDYDQEEQVKEYQVGDLLPVYLLLDGTKEVARLVGEKNAKELQSFLDKELQK